MNKKYNSQYFEHFYKQGPTQIDDVIASMKHIQSIGF